MSDSGAGLPRTALPSERGPRVDVEAADRQMKNGSQSAVSHRANDACGDYKLQSAP